MVEMTEREALHDPCVLDAAEVDRPTTSSDRCRIDPSHPCGSCSAPGPDQCPYLYLLSDLFTYYEHDPDLQLDDDEAPAGTGEGSAETAEAPTGDDPPPDLAHVAVTTH